MEEVMNKYFVEKICLCVYIVCNLLLRVRGRYLCNCCVGGLYVIYKSSAFRLGTFRM